jgi:microcystin-dependent protein
MEPTLGEIRIFAGNFAPRFWQFCNGQLLSIANNQALFSLIGTTYGGDGRTTFGLPDLRGRIPVGTGQGPGLQEWTLGEIQGTETVTMLSSNLASHTHAATSALSVSSAAGSANSPSSNYFAAAQGRDTVTGQGVQVNVYATAPTGPGPFSEASAQVAVSGSSSPINNIQPTLALNFIIAVEGIYPSRG